MKTHLNKITIFICVLLASLSSLAQQRVVTIPGIVPGEPLVYDQIYNAINADAPNRVTNKNVVYELKRGQVYLGMSTINTTDFDLYIRAEAGTGPLPIVFHVLNPAGGSSPMITARKNLTLENIEFDGKHSDGTLGNRFLNMYGLNGRVILKGCRMINDRGGAFAIQVDGVKLYMTDCIIGNQGHHISVGGNGRAVDIRSTKSVDSAVFVNNTIYNLSDRVFRNMAPIINYVKFDHNTILNIQGYHGCIQLGKTKKAVITNNIFSNPLTYGDRLTTRWRAEQTQPDKAFAVITHDSLSTTLTAATVEMRNNNIYHDKMFVDFFNQTPPGDSIADVRPVNNAIRKFVGAAIDQAYFNEPLVFKNTSSALKLYEFLIHWVNYPKAAIFPNNFSEIYPYEWDVSYPTSSKSYTAGDGGLPVGNLNAFPDKKAQWKSGQIGSSLNTASIDVFGNIEVWPNPFTDQTNLAFNLSKNQQIRVEILSNTGQIVKTLINAQLSEGNHKLEWDGTGSYGNRMPSGIYFLKISSENGMMTRKIMRN